VCIYKKIIGLILILYIVQSHICAQDLQFDVRQIINKSQLPSKGNFKAYTDWYGFVWFSTFNGLIRYDGFNCKYYTYNPTNKNSIQSNKINVVKQISHDSLLIGTNNAGLLLYSYKADAFTPITFNNIDKQIMPEIIWDIDIDKNQDIWITTLNGIIHTTKNFTIKTIVNSKIAGNTPADISDFIISSNNEKYVLLRDFGLYKYSHNTLIKIYPTSNSIKQQYLQIVQKNDSRLVLCASTEGIIELDKNGSVKKKININNNTHASVLIDTNGYFIGLLNGGLFYYDFATQLTNEIILEKNIFNQTKPSVTSLKKGNEDIIWVGADNFGIYKLSKNPIFTNHSIIPYTNFPFYNDVTSFLMDKNNNLWVGTDGDGLIKINVQNKKTEILTKNTVLPSNCVSSPKNRTV
jgi:ligand-binding sensor domain-containing protein